MATTNDWGSAAVVVSPLASLTIFAFDVDLAVVVAGWRREKVEWG